MPNGIGPGHPGRCRVCGQACGHSVLAPELRKEMHTYFSRLEREPGEVMEPTERRDHDDEDDELT